MSMTKSIINHKTWNFSQRVIWSEINTFQLTSSTVHSRDFKLFNLISAGVSGVPRFKLNFDSASLCSFDSYVWSNPEVIFAHDQRDRNSVQQRCQVINNECFCIEIILFPWYSELTDDLVIFIDQSPQNRFSSDISMKLDSDDWLFDDFLDANLRVKRAAWDVWQSFSSEK